MVTTGEGGGDVVDGVTRLCRTPAAVAVTETRHSQTGRILSGLTTEKHKRWLTKSPGRHFYELEETLKCHLKALKRAEMVKTEGRVTLAVKSILMFDTF